MIAIDPKPVIDASSAASQKLRCPICRFEGVQFKDYQGEFFLLGERKIHETRNAICPGCGSDVRHRFVYQFLLTRTDLNRRPQTLLHVAPERWLAAKLQEFDHLDYVPADISPSKLNFVDAVHVNFSNLPFDDRSVDAIILLDVLEHIEDDDRAIREVARVLRNGGWALVAVPLIGEITHCDRSLDADGREKLYGLPDRYRLYGKDLAAKFEDSGLEADVVEFTDVGTDFVDLDQESPHIDSDKYLFYVRKPRPRLSIITVTYNAAEVLESTLSSVRDQTFRDFELIIIDGASTDGTLEIMRRYSHSISNWVSETDGGIYDAMNKGLKLATGDYIQFLNAGDYYADCNVLRDVFASGKDGIDLIYGDIRILHVNGDVTYQSAGAFDLESLQKRGTGVLCHQAMFVRRESAPNYDKRYRYKAELNWYFDLVE